MSGGLALLRAFYQWKIEHQLSTAFFLFHSFVTVFIQTACIHGRRKEFFQGRGSRGSSQKFFQGRAKSGEICFLSLEIEKTTFFCQ